MGEQRVRGDLASYYTALLAEQEKSGLSVVEFAEEVGVSSATLYSWRRRLGNGGRGPRLLEVQVDARPQPGVSGAVGLVIGSRFRIEVEADFDENALERLLGVLARC